MKLDNASILIEIDLTEAKSLIGVPIPIRGMGALLETGIAPLP
jgi:hypothetical protein